MMRFFLIKTSEDTDKVHDFFAKLDEKHIKYECEYEELDTEYDEFPGIMFSVDFDKPF